ncbi:hypothetical protein [Streptomyces sp. NPDC091259]|uniref:hypothetical protein n=1 Tax=Streptomyces sp. NPDC091259 TaxID=3365976 RepID=UPI0038175256
MKKNAHLTALVLTGSLVLAGAGPAAADSSACTHHMSGPQVCIRLEGLNSWNAATAIWTNPPRDVNSREVYLYINGRREFTATATRVGKTLSHSWDSMPGLNKYCVRFQGSERMACQSAKDIGDRAPY